MNLDDHLIALLRLTCESLDSGPQIALREVLAALRELAESEGLGYDKANADAEQDYLASLESFRYTLAS